MIYRSSSSNINGTVENNLMVKLLKYGLVTLCLSLIATAVAAEESGNALDKALEVVTDKIQSGQADDDAAKQDDKSKDDGVLKENDIEKGDEQDSSENDATEDEGNDSGGSTDDNADVLAEPDPTEDDATSDDDKKTDDADENGAAESTEDDNAEDSNDAGDNNEPEKPEDEGTDDEKPEDGDNAPTAPSVDKEASTGVDYLDGITCNEKGPCVVDGTGLPLRALPRSFTALFDGASDDAKMISNAVSAFKPVFVFAVKGIDKSDVTDVKGWYQVGFTQRRAMGWMKAHDIVEWRQALLVEYLHPGVGSGERAPVLMFEDKQAVSDVVNSSVRKDRVSDMLKEIEEGGIPDGVIGKEPAQYLNIDDTFYLLPVVDWATEPLLDEPSHYLQVFAAVPGARADEAGESTLKDKDYLSEDAFINVQDSLIDIVFVLDMTGSMQPYINAVKRSMSEMIELIDNSSAEEERLRFGLVGYRDSIEATPELEWNVKNFTEELLPAKDLLKLLDTTSAASVSSDEWSEDVHGGYLAAINSNWRSRANPNENSDGALNAKGQKSVRFMILVGDASGHDLGDDERGYKNSAGINATQLRADAKAAGIASYTIYLQNESAEPDWAKAQSQFKTLASEESGQGPSTYSVFTAGAATNIKDTVNHIGTALICRIEGGSEEECSAPDEVADADKAEDDDEVQKDSRAMIDIADGLMQAAFADYLGDGAKPPKDFLSWVHDYDLNDPYREALGVRVLITRQQFDNIVRQTENLVDTVESVVIGNMDFYVALQTTSAKTSLGLDVTADQTLEEQEFLPKWVSSLPYKSPVLAITPSGFANFSATERKEFQSQLKSKYNAYLEIASTVERWYKLDENDDSLQEVVALPLTSLP